MTTLRKFGAAAVVAAALAPQTAHAAMLNVVEVSAPQINCVFNTECTIRVSDSIGAFTPPGDTGAARVQSRTLDGTAPAPGAGLKGFLYRVDMTPAQAIGPANCVTGLALDFGPVMPLPYSPKGASDVYVITTGGLGTVGLASAIQTGRVITFTFASPVCPGETSRFFGLASKSTTPAPSLATVTFSLGGSATTDDRVPSAK